MAFVVGNRKSLVSTGLTPSLKPWQLEFGTTFGDNEGDRKIATTPQGCGQSRNCQAGSDPGDSSAMQLDYELLKSIHAKLRQITDLNDQLSRLPRMLKAAHSAEAKLLQEYEQAKLSLITVRKVADEKQLQLSGREARIEKMNGQRNAAENNREFQVLGDQIQADQNANAVLSDEILEMLVRVDELVMLVATAKSNHQKGMAESARVQADAVARESQTKANLARATQELLDLEKRMPPQILDEYRRLVRSSSENALAETEGETCGGCYSVVTTQTLSDLYAKKAVFCKNCGSLMYHSAGKLV